MKLLSMLASTFLVLIASTAHAAVVFSTSEVDAAAGSNLDLVVGETGSMYVWMSTEVGQTYAGVGLDILSSSAPVLEATAYEVANPGLRWLSVDAGELGDLVTGWNALSLPGVAGDGLSTDGALVLFSRVDFQATGEGATDLSFAVNAFGIGDLLGTVDPGTISFGTGTVNVAAVPEPSAFALIGALGFAGFLRRRRS